MHTSPGLGRAWGFGIVIWGMCAGQKISVQYVYTIYCKSLIGCFIEVKKFDWWLNRLDSIRIWSFLILFFLTKLIARGKSYFLTATVWCDVIKRWGMGTETMWSLCVIGPMTECLESKISQDFVSKIIGYQMTEYFILRTLERVDYEPFWPNLFLKETVVFNPDLALTHSPLPLDQAVSRTLFLRQLEAFVCLGSSTELILQTHLVEIRFLRHPACWKNGRNKHFLNTCRTKFCYFIVWGNLLTLRKRHGLTSLNEVWPDVEHAWEFQH